MKSIKLNDMYTLYEDGTMIKSMNLISQSMVNVTDLNYIK